ncbi:PP2C family protein-serine/threonine phosphatase [Aureibacter tunicatorum]|uniref:Sigma-B regulation protein RsbU (Phosphoserine phosphatase) n=1 Tax=Aureibacter tunicatorum TaxID=866807 RepID=A0AAE3XRH6_9BACT|nr:PP2C family protein-serine/threonine phosphatase [Aureibacter tunicatorum]MDR6241267.1 sigma-B regulation protein RsbU (phosphoserine phosphatase) [Aureibacter tunicatorum]BDD03527.1 hypothetical protein AUTU_10100 [Aureibacter tunicatorum]
MENVISLESKYKLKELELNALLEITKAINNNLAEESLYRIYEFTLRASLNISKLALYVNDEIWKGKVNFGTKINFKDKELGKEFLELDGIHDLKEMKCDSDFKEFDKAIPVAHKTELLAVVFISYRKDKESAESLVNTDFVQALSNIMLVAIENKKLARKQMYQELINRELEIAEKVQKHLLPKSLPNEGNVQVAAKYQPHHSVGGDYYDLLKVSDEKYIVCIADVSGKGVPAALLMSNFQASLRTIVKKTHDLKEIVEVVNSQVHKGGNSENFITFFIAMIDKERKLMTYVNAGHNPPILFGKEGGAQLLKKGCTVLGFFEPLPFLEIGNVDLSGGFTLFCYTDGLTENFSPLGEEFGESRVISYLSGNINKDLEDIHQGLVYSLHEFKGDKQYDDDITLLSFRLKDIPSDDSA